MSRLLVACGGHVSRAARTRSRVNFTSRLASHVAFRFLGPLRLAVRQMVTSRTYSFPYLAIAADFECNAK